jgi:hypothetical protein
LNNDNCQPPIVWAQSYLIKNGYDIKAVPDITRAMPWSKVTHFATSKGSVYLKEMTFLFSLEPTLIKTMAQWDGDFIPKVIAQNNDLNCFLMEDAGIPLSKFLKEDVQIEILENALSICANIQRKTEKQVDALLSIGVPDWRLSKLPGLYLLLIQQEDILKADGVTPAEIKTLHKLYPRFLFLCDCLSKFNIPETIEHTDFHGNNILIKDNHLTIGDWGDAVVSHPFYSLASYLNSAIRYHGVTEGDEVYNSLQNLYLTMWAEFAPKGQLIEAFHLIQKLRPIQIALSFIRVKMCPNLESSFIFNGYISQALRDFINDLEN